MRSTQKISIVVLMSALCSLSFAQGKPATKPVTKPPASQATSAAPKAQPAQPIALRGGKLLTITKGVIENGVIVMQNGKIAAIGAASAVAIPRNAKVIDVTGMTVYPGLIDSQTQLGLTEIS